MIPGITFWMGLFQNVASFGLVIVTKNFNTTIFWGAAPWSMEDIQKCFRGTCCHIHQFYNVHGNKYLTFILILKHMLRLAGSMDSESCK